MSLVMGIDLGTSSTKTIILDQEGMLVATACASYPMSTPRPGWVEQAPEDWWHAVCATIQESIASLPAPLAASDIKGVAISGQMNGAVPTDQSGVPLRPAILWLDGRSQAECDQANEKAERPLRERALTILNPVNTLAKILWIQGNEPDLYRASKWVLIPKDWVRFRLTGEMLSDVSDASVSGALDLYDRVWSGEILESVGVRDDLFPEVVESTAPAGLVTQSAAGATGLVAGTPVCAGGGDMACMAVGSGAIKPGIVGIGIGTAGHAITYAEDLHDGAFNQLWPMCHSVPDAYFWLGCSYTGGGSLSWFSEQFGDDYESLTTMASEVSAGSDGLFFMPWLAGTGTPHPDARARGGWLGLTLQHGKQHMVRSLMEGVAFDLRQALGCIHGIGLPVTEIRLGEGGVRSKLWRQILVDVFGQEGRLMELGDASAIGAALIAGVGVGVFNDFGEACNRTVQLTDHVRHNPESAILYDACFQKYCDLYPMLKPWFHQGKA